MGYILIIKVLFLMLLSCSAPYQRKKGFDKNSFVHGVWVIHEDCPGANLFFSDNLNSGIVGKMGYFLELDNKNFKAKVGTLYPKKVIVEDLEYGWGGTGLIYYIKSKSGIKRYFFIQLSKNAKSQNEEPWYSGEIIFLDGHCNQKHDRKFHSYYIQYMSSLEEIIGLLRNSTLV